MATRGASSAIRTIHERRSGDAIALADGEDHSHRKAHAARHQFLLPAVAALRLSGRAACRCQADGAGRLSGAPLLFDRLGAGSGGTIELAIERLDDGEVSPFFHEVAAVGDEIELRGPLGGHFVWSDSDGGPLLLVGGGSGVVPLMAMVRHRTARKSSVPVALVFSARIWDEVIFRDELIGLDDRRDGFDLVLTLTREPAQRPTDYSRRIDAAMMMQSMSRLPEPPKLAFVCGSNAFVSAAAQALIDADVPAGLIRTERYGV